MTEKVACSARVQKQWYDNRCLLPAAQERHGHPLCSVHARQFDKWASEDSGLAMAVGWWKWSEEPNDVH